MYYKNIREEELKNKVGEDWFKNFDTTEIIGNIDFSVFPSQGDLFGRIPLLWAEAKTGNYDTTTMFVQLILRNDYIYVFQVVKMSIFYKNLFLYVYIFF